MILISGLLIYPFSEIVCDKSTNCSCTSSTSLCAPGELILHSPRNPDVAYIVVGLLMYLVPNWATVAVLGGRCVRTYSSIEAARAYIIFTFVWQLLVPLGVFLFCYSAIVAVVRRQNKIVNVKTVRVAVAAPEQNLDNVDAAKASKSQNQKMSSGEKKIIKTMLLITLCYTVSWCPVL